MCLDTVADMNETQKTVAGYNCEADIDLGYEKNFHHGLGDMIMRACIYIPIVPFYLRNLLFP